MTSKRTIKTTKKQILKYYLDNIPVNEIHLNFDWSEADEVCWNCASYSNTERCHIIPHSLGGEDTPSNYVLLCSDCHVEAPNVNNSDSMWDWIKSNKLKYSLGYGNYYLGKGIELFEKKHNVEFFNYISEVAISVNLKTDDVLSKYREYLKEDKVSYHFSKRINASSYHYFLEGFINQLKDIENDEK